MANEKRLIEANALCDKLKAHHDFFVNAWGGFANLPVKDKARVDEITHCIAEIVNAPTVDAVEVVHGRWLPQKLLGERVWDCSECKTLGSPQWKFCPVCGAKMDGGNEDEP